MTCESRRGPEADCPNEATRQLVIGCVHEHVRSRLVCDDHAAMAEGGRIICRPCATGAEPHLCQVYPEPRRAVEISAEMEAG
jgi:hypothetical protein